LASYANAMTNCWVLSDT